MSEDRGSTFPGKVRFDSLLLILYIVIVGAVALRVVWDGPRSVGHLGWAGAIGAVLHGTYVAVGVATRWRISRGLSPALIGSLRDGRAEVRARRFVDAGARTVAISKPDALTVGAGAISRAPIDRMPLSRELVFAGGSARVSLDLYIDPTPSSIQAWCDQLNRDLGPEYTFTPEGA